MIPQIIIIAIGMLGLGIHISKHGELKKPDHYNGWSHFLFLIIFWGFLYFVGFWDCLIN